MHAHMHLGPSMMIALMSRGNVVWTRAFTPSSRKGHRNWTAIERERESDVRAHSGGKGRKEYRVAMKEWIRYDLTDLASSSRHARWRSSPTG